MEKNPIFLKNFFCSKGVCSFGFPMLKIYRGVNATKMEELVFPDGATSEFTTNDPDAIETKEQFEESLAEGLTKFLSNLGQEELNENF